MLQFTDTGSGTGTRNRVRELAIAVLRVDELLEELEPDDYSYLGLGSVAGHLESVSDELTHRLEAA